MTEENDNTPSGQPPLQPSAPDPHVEQSEHAKDERDALIAQLRAAVTERDLRITELNQAAAVQAAKQQTANPQGLSTAQDDLRRQRLVNQLGNSHFHQLPPNDRLKLRDFPPASPADIEESATVFGPKSTSLKASQLATMNPSRYKYLRAVAQEHNLL